MRSASPVVHSGRNLRYSNTSYFTNLFKSHRKLFVFLQFSQVKESKRQFIFDVVNEGGEKEKMELFVNFCEDTIFEMQLAAQMSDAGERLAAKEENEQDKPGKENSEMVFLSVTTVQTALLALHCNIILLLKVRPPSLKKKLHDYVLLHQY